MSDKYVIYYLQTRACVVEWPGQCHFLLCRWQSLKQSVWTDDRVTGVDRDISTSVPLELFAKTLETGNILQQVTTNYLKWSHAGLMLETVNITQGFVTKASDKSGVNKLFWNVMVGITRSKVIWSKYVENEIYIHKFCPQSGLTRSVVHFQGIEMKFRRFFSNYFFDQNLLKNEIYIHKFCPQSGLKHSVVHFQGIEMKFRSFFSNYFCWSKYVEKYWKMKFISINSVHNQV